MATTKKTTKDAASKSPVKRFRAKLQQDDSSTATAVTIPFDVQKTFGTRARVPVCGTINGFPYRSSIFPMGGCFMMAVNRELREGAGVRAGDTITVRMERDTEPRTVTPPADLARALRANKDAQAVWDRLSYTHKKEYAGAVESGAPLATWSRVERRPSTDLSARQVEIELPLKPWPSVAELDRQIADSGGRALAERLVRKRRIRRDIGDGTTAKVPVWLWRVGDAILLGQPNEAYSALQSVLRGRFPHVPIAVMNLVNGACGSSAHRCKFQSSRAMSVGSNTI